MVTLHNDTVLLRSKKLVDVTINATALYEKDVQTGLYDVVAIIRGKVGELAGDITIYPFYNVKGERKAKEMCKQFAQDAFYLSRNQPDRFGAYLGAIEQIAQGLPEDRSEMDGIFILFSIPKEYRREDNVLTYRN